MFSVFKDLLNETKDQKPVVDKLNELSGSLLDLIPWHAREGLDKLVTDTSERYRAVCDTVTQQVDQINADILKSQQVNQGQTACIFSLQQRDPNQRLSFFFPCLFVCSLNRLLIVNSLG